MVFIIILVVAVIFMLIGLFFISPSHKKNDRQTESDWILFNAGNRNSYDRANERYSILAKTEQEGTFLSSKTDKAN